MPLVWAFLKESGVMEYQRIDENTIRCIITEEDMESFGLDLDEFLSHSGRSDEFLQYIVSEAKDELGYEESQGIVSMRLEVLNDGRVSLTFGSGNDKQIREQMLKYLKELAESQVAKEIQKAIEKRMKEIAPVGEKEQKETVPKESKEPYRMYCFATLRDVISYVKAIGLNQPIKSHLYKEKDNYYLIADRYRISDYHFNLLTAVAFEYGKVLVGTDTLYEHLKEHGELLIKDKAIGILRKL